MTVPMVILSALAIGAIAAALWAMFREYQVQRENERTAEWSARMLGVQSQTQRALGRESFDEWAYLGDKRQQSITWTTSAASPTLLDRVQQRSATH